MLYDKEALTFTIEEGITTELNLGEYALEMQLIDETGVLSDKLTFMLNIVIPQEDEEEEEESANSGYVVTEARTVDTETGQQYANLLKERADQQQNLDIDPEEIPPPPQANSISINDSGLVVISFTNDMTYIEELEQLNSQYFD